MLEVQDLNRLPDESNDEYARGGDSGEPAGDELVTSGAASVDSRGNSRVSTWTFERGQPQPRGRSSEDVEEAILAATASAHSCGSSVVSTGRTSKRGQSQGSSREPVDGANPTGTALVHSGGNSIWFTRMRKKWKHRGWSTEAVDGSVLAAAASAHSCGSSFVPITDRTCKRRQFRSRSSKAADGAIPAATASAHSSADSLEPTDSSREDVEMAVRDLESIPLEDVKARDISYKSLSAPLKENMGASVECNARFRDLGKKGKWSSTQKQGTKGPPRNLEDDSHDKTCKRGQSRGRNCGNVEEVERGAEIEERNEVKACDKCRRAGYLESLAICSASNEGAQHDQCVKALCNTGMPRAVPDDKQLQSDGLLKQMPKPKLKIDAPSRLTGLHEDGKGSSLQKEGTEDRPDHQLSIERPADDVCSPTQSDYSVPKAPAALLAKSGRMKFRRLNDL